MASTNNLPSDITIDILLKLPENSLLRFKRVCKSWRSLIEDPQFIKHHYYLNQIIEAFKKDRDCSMDDSIIEPPSVITHQFCINFVKSRVNGVFLLAVPLDDKIIFWNPEDLTESTSVRFPFQHTTLFTVGGCTFMIKDLNEIDEFEVWSMSKNGSTSSSWRKMLEIEEQGPHQFLKKGKKGNVEFLFYRRNKYEYAVYDSKTHSEAKRKLKRQIAGQVTLFIDRTYVETLISPDATILDPQVIKCRYYLNQIFKALKKDRDLSMDESIIELPSVISHQLSVKFVNSHINGLFLLAAHLPGKIVFWNPEDLNESTSIYYPIRNTTPFALGECVFLAKSLMVPFSDTSTLEVWSTSKNGSTSCSWRKMLETEEEGPLFLKKRTGDFLFFRRDKNECVVYDSKSQKLNEVTDGMIEAKRKLKEYKIGGPQVSLFIDRTYAEDLISPNATIL